MPVQNKEAVLNLNEFNHYDLDPRSFLKLAKNQCFYHLLNVIEKYKTNNFIDSTEYRLEMTLKL